MQGVDANRVLSRFSNDLELMKQLQLECVDMRFNERELKEIIYLIGNLKAYMERERLMSITEQIESVKADICNHYCKYPNEWDEKKEGIELCDSDICENCPLNRL